MTNLWRTVRLCLRPALLETQGWKVVPCTAVLRLHFQHYPCPCVVSGLVLASSCVLLGCSTALQMWNVASSLCREKPQIVATHVKEQAVVLFLGERHYTEFSIMDGRKMTVAHPLVPSKCPQAVLILLHWMKVMGMV